MKGLRFSRKQLGIPYALFLICFVVAPLFVIIYYAFTNGEDSLLLPILQDFHKSQYPWNSLLQLRSGGCHHMRVSASGVSHRIHTCEE